MQNNHDPYDVIIHAIERVILRTQMDPMTHVGEAGGDGKIDGIQALFLLWQELYAIKFDVKEHYEDNNAHSSSFNPDPDTQ